MVRKHGGKRNGKQKPNDAAADTPLTTVKAPESPQQQSPPDVEQQLPSTSQTQQQQLRQPPSASGLQPLSPPRKGDVGNYGIGVQQQGTALDRGRGRGRGRGQIQAPNNVPKVRQQQASTQQQITLPIKVDVASGVIQTQQPFVRERGKGTGGGDAQSYPQSQRQEQQQRSEETASEPTHQPHLQQSRPDVVQQLPSTSRTQQQQVRQPQPVSGLQPLSSPRKGVQTQQTSGTGGRDMQIPTTKSYPPSQVQEQQQRSEKAEMQLSVKQKRNVGFGGTKAIKRIKLETNHFALSLGDLKQIVHYDVVIEPSKAKWVCEEVMEKFRVKYYPKMHPVFDGKKNLIASCELPFGKRITGTISLDKEYTVTVKFASYVDLTNIQDYLNTIKFDRNYKLNHQEALQCIDIVLRSAPAVRLTPVGRFFLTESVERFRGRGMEMCRGFYQSAIIAWKPFLNVDVTHKVLPVTQSVVDLVVELFGNVDSLIGDHTKIKQLKDYLRSLKIKYEIPGRPSSKRIHTVKGLGNSAGLETFIDDKGIKTTVKMYFTTVKGYNLRYPDLPLIKVGDKKPILLPMEFCTVLGNHGGRKDTANEYTREMIKQAATSTDVRKQRIMEAMKSAGINDSPSMIEFGFHVSNKFEEVDGRVLEPPSLQYDGGMNKPRKGVWWNNMKFLVAKEIKKWAIISIDAFVNADLFWQLQETLHEQGQLLGMNIPEAMERRSFKLKTNYESDEMRKILMGIKDCDLILVVIPEYRYSLVKQVAELSVGCLTQCLLQNTLKKIFKYDRIDVSIVQNLLKKINSKLNGMNHRLQKRPRCLDEVCMVMGADVTHPPPGPQNNSTPSVAAVTASHDIFGFRYNFLYRLQKPNVEVIEDLKTIVREQLEQFRQSSGQIPKRIIMYRDGVSDGFFEKVLNYEIPAMRQACLELQPNGEYKPAITFLVAQKRHNTRFFPTSPDDCEDKNNNIPTGTVIDTVITNPATHNFYLKSHASIQGVARPTKYHVLWDDSDFTDDDIQELTYHLCYMFARCNRSVSYPAPTYYAHLAAARAKVYLDKKLIDLNVLQEEERKLTIQKDFVERNPMFFV